MSKKRSGENDLTKLLNLLAKEEYDKAEKALKKLKEKNINSEWYAGYLSAIEGIIFAVKSNTPYALINEIRKNPDNAELNFLFNNKLSLSEYDSGFLCAWRDLIKLLTSTKRRELSAE